MSDGQREGLSVRAVTRLTGIAEHLLRAWERRYRIVVPTRTEGGTRRYSDADVNRLRQVKHAVDAGHSIGSVAKMSADDLAGLAEPGDDVAKVVQPLLAFIEESNGQGFEQEVSKLAAWLGPTRWAVEVVSPFSAEVGRRWRSGTLTIGQEHLATSIVGRVIDSARSRLEAEREDVPESALPSLILATPPSELHLIGIQLAALIGSARGFPIAMLGTQMPHDALGSFLDRVNDAMVVVGITKLSRATALAYLNNLRESVRAGIPIMVGGASVRGMGSLPDGVATVSSLKAFDDELEALSRRRRLRSSDRQ